MTDITDNSIPTLANGFRFQWEPAQNSHVLLYPEGMKVLSGSAAEIVQLCDGERATADIVAALEEKFPDVELRGDVIEFLQQAVTEGWMHV
jgi:pyrroloquinoline quinone biosynthesis protein D